MFQAQCIPATLLQGTKISSSAGVPSESLGLYLGACDRDLCLSGLQHHGVNQQNLS